MALVKLSCVHAEMLSEAAAQQRTPTLDCGWHEHKPSATAKVPCGQEPVACTSVQFAQRIVDREGVLMMAEQRPVWRGHLRLALVSCPVAMYTARHDQGNLHFHMLNPKTGNRIRMIMQDAETGDELSRGDLVKGYEYKKGAWLTLSDEDFETARVPSSSTMKVDNFVDLGSIDPIYFDASYYLAPDGDAGADVYLVLREAVVRSGKAALSRVVIAQRERAIAIMPMGRGLVVHTLHEARDLNSPDGAFGSLPEIKIDADMVKLAEQLIARQAGTYDPADFEDRYEARLRDLIHAKLEGKGLDEPEEDETDQGNVVDLMAALRRSLGESETRSRKPAAKRSAPSKSVPPAKRRARAHS